MDEFCRVCNTGKHYKEYHKLYRRCNKCKVRCFLKCYYASRDETLDKKKLIYQNNKGKINSLNRKKNDIYENELRGVILKIESLI